MAAADYVIIPSRFEPCGLVAQSAARYGAIPIVTAVGGLKDFVTEEVGLMLTVTHLSSGVRCISRCPQDVEAGLTTPNHERLKDFKPRFAACVQGVSKSVV